MPPRADFEIDLIGTGRLAAALAAWMRARGEEPSAPRLATLVSRDGRRARRLARRWGARRGVTLAAYLPAAAVVVLAVPDDALGTVAARLAKHAGGQETWRGRVVLHTSGLQPASVLAALGRRGASIGSLHPLMTFGAGRPAPLPRDLVFAVEGQARAAKAARRMVRSWGGRVLALRAREKTLYHLAATWASPMVVANFAVATAMLGRAGLGGRRLAVARMGLARLTMRTAENLAAAAASGDLHSAWTGPIARGDRETMRRHLAAAGEWAAAYRDLARAAVKEIGGRRG